MPFVILGINLALTRKELSHFARENGQLFHKTFWDWYNVPPVPVYPGLHGSVDGGVPADTSEKVGENTDGAPPVDTPDTPAWGHDYITFCSASGAQNSE